MEGKRKREGAHEVRKRAFLACDTCRRQKEKCEGGQPCWRCKRLGRECHFQNADIQIQTPESHEQVSSNRVAKLEQIVRHYVGDGDVILDEKNLDRIIEQISVKSVPSDQENENALDISEPLNVRFISKDTAHYSGEFSHWNFSQKLRRRMSCHVEQCEGVQVKEYWRPTQLQSPVHIIAEAMAQLPPRAVADFLVSLFFKYVQVNCFYIEQKWTQEKLDLCYNQDTQYTVCDIAWVCSIFTVLAIGTQVAHMEDRSDSNQEELKICSEDSVGLVFYHVACRLVPDVIVIASHESVQACLLLATFTLPLSTGELAYTYLGLAIKMAVVNGMHRKYVGGSCDGPTIELRNRLFWMAYTLDRRVSIMHGRPGSIARSEINADLPTQMASFETPNFANMTAFIRLISWLGEAADILTQFRQCPKSLVSRFSDRIIRLRTNIQQWWESLPASIECRDLRPEGALFRQNVHLRLCYLLIYIYMGRPFIFYDNNEETLDSTHRSTLVKDCIQSAFDILDALQSLSDNIGLCRASYTEFSSCRAALLVLLAECLNSPSKRLRDALTRGMILIRQMTGGSSSESEISIIASLEAAIRRVSAQDTSDGPASAYAEFKRWTETVKRGNSGTVELSSFSPVSFLTGSDGWHGLDLHSYGDVPFDADAFLNS